MLVELASQIYQKGIFPFGIDEEMNQFAQSSAVGLWQKQELRGQISRFTVTSSSPRAALLSSSLCLPKVKHFFFNFTFTFGHSAGHARRNFGQGWVCQRAARTLQRRCFLRPEPGHVSVNGKGPIGSMARVSVINTKLAPMDDDIMAGQRRATNFRAVDNTYQVCHMPCMASTWCCRDENTYREFFCLCVYLLVFYSYPLLNYMSYYLISV